MNIPERSVEANQLHSTELPCLRVQIDPDLTYIGNFKATVLENAQIDNYYFVDKNADGQIQRILYFQFESLFDNNDDIYDYPDMKDINVAGHDFGYDGGVRMYRQAKIDEQAENSDVRRTVDFLKANDAQFVEGEFYGTLRFAQIMEDKRKDLLIIYLERMEEAAIPEDVIAKSRRSDEWSDFCEQFLARALRTFAICD